MIEGKYGKVSVRSRISFSEAIGIVFRSISDGWSNYFFLLAGTVAVGALDFCGEKFWAVNALSTILSIVLLPGYLSISRTIVDEGGSPSFYQYLEGFRSTGWMVKLIPLIAVVGIWMAIVWAVGLGQGYLIGRYSAKINETDSMNIVMVWVMFVFLMSSQLMTVYLVICTYFLLLHDDRSTTVLKLVMWAMLKNYPTVLILMVPVLLSIPVLKSCIDGAAAAEAASCHHTTKEGLRLASAMIAPFAVTLEYRLYKRFFQNPEPN